MVSDQPRRRRAGERVDDLCRACKVVRTHVIVAVDSDGTIAQVLCDYCGSRHRFRGGRGAVAPEPAGTVPERQRSLTVNEVPSDLETMLRRVIREEGGWSPTVPADRWRGGEMVLRPGRPGLQEKSWPIDTFFHKVVMLRNRLRVLEQQVNALDVPEDVKVKLQAYVTGCYGSLTSFNVLFADPDDRFRGSGGED